jgi:hypothetical protein
MYCFEGKKRIPSVLFQREKFIPKLAKEFCFLLTIKTQGALSLKANRFFIYHSYKSGVQNLTRLYISTTRKILIKNTLSNNKSKSLHTEAVLVAFEHRVKQCTARMTICGKINNSIIRLN